MDTAKHPNRRLAAVMTEAGVSNKGLAVRVRAEAEAAGFDISPNHKSVRLWLEGTQPRERTVRCIASALSRKLGRMVTAAEIGYAEPSAAMSDADVISEGVHYPADPAQSVELIDTLASADLDANTTITTAHWEPDASPAAITDYLFAGPLWNAPQPTEEIAPTDIAVRIRATVRSITDLDFQFGGGHVRQLLLTYWKTEIAPELRKDHPTTVRRDLFGAAAEAAEILGWSAYDDGRHGAAQRYNIQGLRLAREAADPLKGAQILANLSHQANYLGHFDKALRLARAAQSAIGTSKAATVRAMFLAMEARALASLGESSGCIAALAQAEKSYAHRDGSADPAWISYFDEFELAGEAAHCFRDLGLPTETLHFASEALDLMRTPARTRSFINMVNAAGELRSGNLDTAVNLVVATLQTSGSIKSERYRRYVRDFCRSIPANQARSSAARDLDDLVRTIW